MNFANPALRIRGVTGMRFMLMATLAAGMLGMNAGRGTLAYFTTQVTSTGNSFTAGNLHFTLDDSDETGLQTVTSSIVNPNIAPTKSTQAPLTLNNTGTLDAKYGIALTTSSTTGHDLGPALQISVRAAGTGATAANCVTDDFTTSTHWTAIGVENVAITGGATPQVLIDQATGAARLLANTTGSDLLCFKVAWPDGGTPGSLTTGDNAFNGATAGFWETDLAFAFNGLVQ